jgi:hypothetical protein
MMLDCVERLRRQLEIATGMEGELSEQMVKHDDTGYDAALSRAIEEYG